MIQEEIWRDIKGYEGHYQVSSFGNVRSCTRTVVDSRGISRILKGKQMKLSYSSSYASGSVDLTKDGVSTTYSLDRLVAAAFIPFYHNQYMFHKDGVVTNNNVDNLTFSMPNLERKYDNGFYDIKGYEGYYQINRKGQVRSVDRYVISKNGSYKVQKGCILNPANCNGYLCVHLMKRKSKQKLYNVHRLVATMFIPNPENKPTVNHIDGNKYNNCVENLEWATYSEQQIHAKLHGLANYSIEHLRALNEPRKIKVKNLKDGKVFDSLASASKYYDVDNNYISRCIHGKQKRFKDIGQFVKVGDKNEKTTIL